MNMEEGGANASPNQNFESPGEGMEGGDMDGGADYGRKIFNEK